MALSFRGLTFDPATRQVFRGSQEIRLTRKAFDLLALLVERRPDAVSKEEIHARLWPETFVSEITLHGLIAEIRRALGDNSNQPLFVRTVHGFGYSFICPEDEQPAAAANTSRRVRGWLIFDQDRLPVFEGENVFGRGDAGVTELPSSTVSRRHARIRVDHDFWLEDLGSKNGTFVRDERIMQVIQLFDGDRVRFGSLLTTFRLSRAADATSTRSTTDFPVRRN
jgi:DNA-binding winged helix-turn-helix (wHTH) protein